MQDYDAEEIQEDIQKSGKDQKIQGRFAVSHGPEDTGNHIIQNGGRNTGKNNHNIGICSRKYIIRRPHQPENRFAEYYRRYCHNHRKKQGQPGTVSHILSQCFIIFGAEALGNRNGESIADAHTETDYQEINGACAPHCRE